MSAVTIPELPKLYYSTWGYDFYSEHWMAKKNCWMYSLLKYAEANIDLEKDLEALPLFESLTGSDYIFMHTDSSQWEGAQESFLELFQTAMAKIPTRKTQVSSVFPVDPFVNYFTYITTEKPAEEPVFTISKLIEDDLGKSLGAPNYVTLEPTLIEKGGLYIYAQYFLLHPESRHSFEVSCMDEPYYFETPDLGMPMLTTGNMRVKAKYDFANLNKQLEEVWDVKERIAVHTSDYEVSQSIYRRTQLEEVLKGKKVAIFKYNKEAYSLLRFKELSCFETAVVFDDSVELEDAATYIHADKTSIPVVNDLDKVDEIDFDAVILTCAINYETEVRFLKKIMDKAMAGKYPVVSLYDDVLKYADIFEGSEDKSHFYKISVKDFSFTESDVETYRVFKPKKTLAIFGTDSVQGKFTTQIYLREALRARGVKASHFATEPTGTLLSAEVGFSRLDDDHMETRFVVHRMVQDELEQESDLLITGGQNSIVYAPTGASHRDNASSLIFREFNPNYMIFTVAVDTTDEVITKAMEYLEQLSNERETHTRLLGFAIMGGRKLQGSRWTETYFMDVRENKIEEAKERVKKLTGLPIFSIPQEADALAEMVEKAVNR